MLNILTNPMTVMTEHDRGQTKENLILTRGINGVHTYISCLLYIDEQDSFPNKYSVSRQSCFVTKAS